MSWLRLDDGFTGNGKIVQLTDREFRAWLRLLCYCTSVQDPTVDRHVLREISGVFPRDILRFNSLFLLDKVGEKYEVHDWEKYLPKDTGTERQARWRARKALDTTSTPPSTSASTPASTKTSTRAQTHADLPVPSPTPESRPQAAADLKEPGLNTPRPLEPAAAETEPPSEAAILVVVAALKDSDPGTGRVLMPLARRLPGPLWRDVVARHQQRIQNPRVMNHAGSLIHLTQLAATEISVRARAALVPSQTPSVRLLDDARSYARAQHPWDVVEPLVARFVARNGLPVAALGEARAAYDGAALGESEEAA